MTSKLTLYQLKQGEVAELVSVLTDKMAARRLTASGLIPGTKVKFLRKAPLGGPIEIEVRDSKLMLGSELASRIICKKLSM